MYLSVHKRQRHCGRSAGNTFVFTVQIILLKSCMRFSFWDWRHTIKDYLNNNPEKCLSNVFSVISEFHKATFFLKVLKCPACLYRDWEEMWQCPRSCPSVLPTRHSASPGCCLGSLSTNCCWVLENIKHTEHTANNGFCQLVNQLKTSMT